MKTLRSKFILVISTLIILVILVTSGILVNQKRLELQEDIYTNARSFGELTSAQIVDLTQTTLKQDNFLFFTRDLTSLLKKNPDITSIKVYDFSGKILFDSSTEQQKQYSGPQRSVTDQKLLSRIKAANPSIVNFQDNTYFLETISPGEYEVVTPSQLRTPHAENLKNFRQIRNLIFPVNSQFAVEYNVTYQNLINRLVSSALPIIILGLISILVSGFIGYILSTVVTNPLKKLTDIVTLIAKGDFTKRAEVKSQDEVGVLAESVNQMAVDLEASTEARVYKEKVKKELEIAAKIQRELLPEVLPKIPNLDLAATVIPATEIGGDVYDVLLDKSQIPYFYVGDVTGHGVPAGLISSVTNAIITSTVDLANPVEIVANLNHVLKDKSAGNLFLTLLFARFINSKIEYISAGHEKVLFYSAKSQKLDLLPPGGIALGLFDNISDKLELRTVDFAQGDYFIIYTDGIPEAWKNDTDQYGESRLLEVTNQAIVKNLSAEKVKETILDDVKSFMGSYEQKDDITILVIRHT